MAGGRRQQFGLTGRLTKKPCLRREMARVLQSRPPKIVSGPEILDKWVGEAERNVRALFYEAEREWEERGAHSGLHVIIFDEMDALTRTRGSLAGDSSGPLPAGLCSMLSSASLVASCYSLMFRADSTLECRTLYTRMPHTFACSCSRESLRFRCARFRREPAVGQVGRSQGHGQCARGWSHKSARSD